MGLASVAGNRFCYLVLLHFRVGSNKNLRTPRRAFQPDGRRLGFSGLTPAPYVGIQVRAQAIRGISNLTGGLIFRLSLSLASTVVNRNYPGTNTVNPRSQ